MAETNAPNLTIVAILSTTCLFFICHHVYKFDGGRCLVPGKKDWFRSLLTWMLVLSNICLMIWAIGWAYVKYSLRWVKFGSMGARPWPSALFPAAYTGFNKPLTILLGLAYTLQASLNAEEGLFFYHLMRTVRRPAAAKPFLKSYFFYAWIVISLAVAAIQMSAPWMAYTGDLQIQLSTELLTGGLLELIVVCASTIVLVKFPRFLEDIKTSGAGPEVRSRLFFYHELNKARTFFRFTFTLPLIILGGDGITSEAIINNYALVADILVVIMVGSLCAVMMISIILYLPRSAPSASQHKVMVGNVPQHPGHTTSGGFALITLLREGGQWDGVDDDIAQDAEAGGRLGGDEAPFARSEAMESRWSAGMEEKWQGSVQPTTTNILDDFTSPFAVSTTAQPQRPVEVRVHVEREVHND